MRHWHDPVTTGCLVIPRLRLHSAGQLKLRTCSNCSRHLSDLLSSEWFLNTTMTTPVKNKTFSILAILTNLRNKPEHHCTTTYYAKEIICNNIMPCNFGESLCRICEGGEKVICSPWAATAEDQERNATLFFCISWKLWGCCFSSFAANTQPYLVLDNVFLFLLCPLMASGFSYLFHVLFLLPGSLPLHSSFILLLVIHSALDLLLHFTSVCCLGEGSWHLSYKKHLLKFSFSLYITTAPSREAASQVYLCAQAQLALA